MKTMKFELLLTFDDDGKLDRESVEANLNYALARAREEGAITPDDDDHAMLIEIDLTPS